MKHKHKEASSFSTMNIPAQELSNSDVPGRMYGSSKSIKFTKGGQVMSEEHRKFRERLKEAHQRQIPSHERSISGESTTLNSELLLPDFIQNNFVMNPIIGLKLIIKKEEMYFDQTKEEVVFKVLNEIDQIIE